ncbi:right-handed parallel beta-helix repeat-containing protein [Rhizobium laguerreae]|uniref:right-handed parallel beta-helix repeat-containing protein n=1 Tax=Rhizobium laguerreae TaxID=1076926 RepID=UPI001C912BD8|nr:right-handed parallel beta-helix repeat-containing protein [Rhizobium laguerreae]MBY3263881.1 right-handed parallel beta-helix repeat-containing protein [Rhizobium laguerreae]
MPAPTAAVVFDDYNTSGVPSSGSKKVKKSEARSWGAWLESFISAVGANAGSIYATKAELDADLSKSANSMAWVMSDPVAANNGIYRKSGAAGTGSWSRIGDLPYSFITAIDIGAGTANAIQATSDIPVSESALVVVNVFEANTGSPVTIAFNGGSALTVKTNSGNDVVSGGLVAGMRLFGYVSGSTFQLISDQVSSSIVAAAEAAASDAEAAKDAAEAAAASVTLPSPVALNYLRMKADLSGYETRTPTQVRTDIGAAALGSVDRKVKAFGAVGDAVIIRAAVTITTGTAALTVTGANFQTTDVGKSIAVEGAGAGGATLYSTILSRTSTTQVTLANNAGTTVTATTKTVTYGTNDSAAFNAAIADIVRQGSSNDNAVFGGTVVVDAGSRYYLGTQIAINKHGVKIKSGGSHTDTCIIVAHEGYGFVFDNTDSGTALMRSNCVEGLRFLSTASTRAAGSGALSFNRALQFTVKDCWFAGRQFSAIHMQDCLDGIVQKNRVDGPVEASINGFTYGFWLDSAGVLSGPNQITIENNWIENCGTTGIRVTGGGAFSGNQVNIRENLIQGGSGNGIMYDKQNGLFVLRNWFEDNGRDGVSGRAAILDIGGSVSHLVVFKENVFGGNNNAHADFRQFNVQIVNGLKVLENFFTGGSHIRCTTSTAYKVYIADNWSSGTTPTVDAMTSDVVYARNTYGDTGTAWTTG